MAAHRRIVTRMKAAKTSKTIEHPPNTGVLIREVPNITSGERFGSSYLVTIPRVVTGADRKRKQFSDLGAAKEWATNELGTGRELGRTFYNLTDHEKRLCV